jgi:hypothetical protein
MTAAQKEKPTEQEQKAPTEQLLANASSELYSTAMRLRKVGWPAHRRLLERSIEALEDVIDQLHRAHFAMPVPAVEIVAEKVERARKSYAYRNGVVAFDPETFENAEWEPSKADHRPGVEAV